MRLPGYYSSGQFARMANVSLRTIRYYDQQNILKPSFVNDSGARFYTDADFARLQQILLLKYLGFSLNDIREMTIKDMDYHFMLNSLKMQKKLIQDKIEQMQLVENAINNTTEAIEQNREINWSQMLDLIHLTGMENSMKSQQIRFETVSLSLLGGLLYLWQFYPCTFCKNPDCLRKCIILVFHKEGIHISSLSASKTVKDLALPVYRKRGRFFIMKRTQTKVCTSLFFQFYIS